MYFQPFFYAAVIDVFPPVCFQGIDQFGPPMIIHFRAQYYVENGRLIRSVKIREPCFPNSPTFTVMSETLCVVQRPSSQVLLLLAPEETGAALAVHPKRGGLLPPGSLRSPGRPREFQTQQALWEVL